MKATRLAASVFLAFVVLICTFPVAYHVAAGIRACGIGCGVSQSSGWCERHPVTLTFAVAMMMLAGSGVAAVLRPRQNSTPQQLDTRGDNATLPKYAAVILLGLVAVGLLSGIRRDVESTQSDVSTLATEVSAVSASVDTIESDVSEIQSAVGDIQAR